jgi:CheY-like chemotaxis protein
MLPTAVASAEEALAALRDGQGFALVLLAVAVPDRSGLELASAIASDPALRGAPVIVLASAVDPSFKRDALQLGATVCLFKPVKQSHLYDAVVTAVASRKSKTGPLSPVQREAALATRMPLRILIAEDNSINQKVALLFLERLGYRADAVANGLEVLDAVQSCAYDVILMDMQMPEMDGVEATRRIRALESTASAGRPRPRIIAVTANVLQEDHDVCMEAGMDDILTKPIKLNDLTAVLTRAFEAGRAAARRAERA